MDDILPFVDPSSPQPPLWPYPQSEGFVHFGEYYVFPEGSHDGELCSLPPATWMTLESGIHSSVEPGPSSVQKRGEQNTGKPADNGREIDYQSCDKILDQPEAQQSPTPPCSLIHRHAPSKPDEMLDETAHESPSPRQSRPPDASSGEETPEENFGPQISCDEYVRRARWSLGLLDKAKKCSGWKEMTSELIDQITSKLDELEAEEADIHAMKATAMSATSHTTLSKTREYLGRLKEVQRKIAACNLNVLSSKPGANAEEARMKRKVKLFEESNKRLNDLVDEFDKFVKEFDNLVKDSASRETGVSKIFKNCASAISKLVESVLGMQSPNYISVVSVLDVLTDGETG